ncbi:MAG: hypothetical protein RLO17_02535 [Cyclobacteriaceae bacterium]
MLTVRLDPELEDFLNQYSEDQNISKSSVVKEALALYFKEHKVSNRPFDLGAEFFGQFGSGDKDRSVTYKKRIKEKLREKHSH